jgi:hypothetical protein
MQEASGTRIRIPQHRFLETFQFVIVYIIFYPGLDLDLGTGVAAAVFPPPPAAIQVPGSGLVTYWNMCNIVKLVFFGAVVSDTIPRLLFTIGCR